MDKINYHQLDNSKVFGGSTYTTHGNSTTGLHYPTFEQQWPDGFEIRSD